MSLCLCVLPPPMAGLLSPSGHISEQLWLLSLCVCMYRSRVRSVAVVEGTGCRPKCCGASVQAATGSTTVSGPATWQCHLFVVFAVNV